jgi:hypothetical protein
VRTVLSCGCFTFVIASALAATRGAEFVEIRVLEEFHDSLLQNSFLMQGGIDVVTTDKGEEMLVGVGVCVFPQGDQGSAAKLAAERKAKANADRAIAQFLRADVSTTTTLQLETSVETEKIGEQEVERRKRVSKYLQTYMEERATMARRIKQIGSWLDSERQFMYVAVGIFPEM